MRIWRGFNAIPDVQLPDDSITRRPSIDLEAFVEPEARKGFFEILNWIVGEIQELDS